MKDRVINDSVNRITQRYNPPKHNGVDLGWRSDENQNKVYSNSKGKVITTVTGMKPMPQSTRSYGNYVKIDHYNGMYSLYAHLRSVNVKQGQEVDENTQIGVIGDTGATINSKGIPERHLHYEVFNGNNKINPTPYLTKSIYSGSPTPTPSGNTTIKYIQGTLNQRYNTGLVCDGYYGNLTKRALIKGLQHELNIQFNARISEDGIFGPATKNACRIVSKGARGNITWLIQAKLYCIGYSTNGIDGIYGNGTQDAVRRFQANNRLIRDGICGKNTFEKLFK